MKLRKGMDDRHLLSGLRLRIPVLSAFVLLGIVAGQIAGHCVSPENLQEIADSLMLYEENPVQLSFARVLTSYLRWPSTAFLLGYCTLGIGLLPLLCGIEGFLMSFSVSCFCLVMGRSGIVLSLATLGIRALFVLPCGLAMSDWAFSRACRMAAGEKLSRHLPLRLFACAAVLAVGICLEYILTPRWISLVLAG